jgi:glutathione peroxidase-family protein/uncharacterized membrane protein
MKNNAVKTIMRLLIGGAMVFASVAHFTFARAEFQAQVPNWLPLGKDLVVILSGIAELALGLAMIFATKWRKQAGYALALFYVLIFPGNIAQYVNHISAFGLDTDQARLIRLFFQPVLILWALYSTGAFDKEEDVANSFYDLDAIDLKGRKVSMSDFKGKTVMVVNTASKCGLTPQYEGLEALYKKYQDKGLVILGFPSNQFANQEPGTSDDIAATCSINYGVTFPMFSKVDVNGAEAHPVFKFLKAKAGSYFINRSVKWNFTKFLVDKSGNVVMRFSPYTKPEELEKDLVKYL